jgi:hypothetical protein
MTADRRTAVSTVRYGTQPEQVELLRERAVARCRSERYWYLSSIPHSSFARANFSRRENSSLELLTKAEERCVCFAGCEFTVCLFVSVRVGDVGGSVSE